MGFPIPACSLPALLPDAAALRVRSPFHRGDASLRGSSMRLTVQPCEEKFVTDGLHFSALFEDIVLASLRLHLLGNWSQLHLRGEELPKGAAAEDAAEEGSRLCVLGGDGHGSHRTSARTSAPCYGAPAFGWQCHALPSWHDCAHTVLPAVRGSLGSAKGWPRGALPWAGAPFPCVCPTSWGCHEPPTHPVTV